MGHHSKIRVSAAFASTDKMRPGAGLFQLRMSRAGGNALHHPCQILAEVAQRLRALGIHLHLTRAHTVNHVPVERADEGLVVVGDVLIKAVKRGAGTTAAGHSHRGTGLVSQLGTGRVIQTVKQRTERTIRAGKIGRTSQHNGVNTVQLVIDIVIQLIIHAAATGLETLAAADAPLHSRSTNLHDFRLHSGSIHGLCNHGKSMERVTFGIRTTIDQKSFHAG